MSNAKHWYVFPAVAIMLGAISFVRSGGEPTFAALLGLAWVALGLLTLVDAEAAPESLPTGMMSSTCQCPACHQRVKTDEALWLNRHGDPYFAQYSEFDLSAYRCPACKARFRQVALGAGTGWYQFAALVFAVSLFTAFVALALFKYWIAAFSGVLVALSLRYLSKNVGYEVVGGGIDAEKLLPLPDANARTTRSKLWRTMYALLPGLALVFAQVVAKKLNYPMPEWLGTASLIASFAGVGVMGAIASVVGWRAVARAAWPVLDTERYPLRPLKSLEGRRARTIGWIYACVGLAIAVGSLGYAAFVLASRYLPFR